jgi:hypothetical protein
MKVLMLIIRQNLLVNGKLNYYILIILSKNFRFAWVNSLFAELVIVNLDKLENWLQYRRLR